MVSITLKDTHLGGITTTALQNKISTFQTMYYDKDTRIMVDQPVNNFYTQLLFKIEASSQDVEFPLDIAATFLNNLIPEIRTLLIPEGVQVAQRPRSETNHHRN